MRWAKIMIHMGEKINTYSVLVDKYEGKGQLRKSRRRWKGVDRINLAEDRDRRRIYKNTVMNIRFP
jgi:hypothetical protein